MPDSIDPEKSTEPSVLDYVKSQIRFWEKDKLSLDNPVLGRSAFGDESESIQSLTPPLSPQSSEIESITPLKIPWLTLSAFFLAILAQLLLEPSPNRSAIPGIVLYILVVILLVVAELRKEWFIPTHQEDSDRQFSINIRIDLLLAALVLAGISFALFGKGEFNFFNTCLWLAAILLICMAFWERSDSQINWKGFFKHRNWWLEVTPWCIMLLLAVGIVLFFRLAYLNTVPPEMISDQAERVLGVFEVVKGNLLVFFTRNTVNEPVQFYWSALITRIFGLQVSFLSIKLASALAGLITLIYMYFLGKEVGNKWVGLMAMLFCGMAYWPNLQSRAALGGIYFPLFLAAMLYHLLKGLRQSNRNQFVLAGLASGLGLLAVREFLIVPVLPLLAVILYITHKPSNSKSAHLHCYERSAVHVSQDHRQQAWWGLVMMLLVGLVLFLPVLRVFIADPQLYLYRIFSRLSDWERELPGNSFGIFLGNLWAALTMFFWSNASSWVDAIPKRPALDFISGALFLIGLVVLILRYIRERHWLDLFILLSIPILLLPSVLSLAFPEENPSLSRASGAIVPVFLVIGLAIFTLTSTLMKALPGRLGKGVATALTLLLLLLSGQQNYTLVFKSYYQTYQVSAWNNSEMAGVIRQFGDTIGSYENAWVLGYPYWVDTRSVAMEAGLISYDFALWPEQIEQTRLISGAKMFLLNVNDEIGKDTLQTTYPNGLMSEYQSAVKNKNFMIFLVPTDQGVTP